MLHTQISTTCLAVLVVASPAGATTHTVHVDPVDGTFSPKYVEIRAGDTVEWVGLGRTDALARIATSALDAGGATAPDLNPSRVCSDDKLLEPGTMDSIVHIDPMWMWNETVVAGLLSYTQPFDGADPDELGGPTRTGVSGIWALGPEGGKTSYVEIPSPEADALAGVSPAPLDCAALMQGWNDVQVDGVVYHRVYREASIGRLPGSATDAATGAPHLLCEAITLRCTLGGVCDPAPVSPDAARPETIAPGTYLNGLLTSTYANPDLTGVVLRFNWRDLQYDDGGTIRERWEHLDRELERAIAHGKLVTLDVRAGMFGTPPWIFQGYRPAGFTASHPSAGRVRPLRFLDYYDEPDHGCGSPVVIGAPGDVHYRALYTDFIARLATHVASDARWFQALAHVKVSGANLRTSEAELPHSCDDRYTNTAEHHAVTKAALANPGGDRVLDTFKILRGTNRVTDACECNPETWFRDGYTPHELYTYYAQVERQIVDGFFGRKSLGYQIIQDGFPRADAGRGGFLGDHLYRERLTPDGRNEGTAILDHCTTPSTGATGPEVDENRALGGYEYCSADVDGTGAHVFLALDALAADPGLIAPHATRDDDGVRYPTAFEQAEAVLDQAGDGRFMDTADAAAGKLFVPQHSGLQPMPQEQLALGYGTVPSWRCRQQRTTVITAIGPVAQFPMPEATPVSELNDLLTTGCPNRWIVEQGKDLDDGAVADEHPPQLTGFQTTNRVRTPGEVESALFNLTYNTNAVFIELYEDALWRIARTRGTGPGAYWLSDPLIGRDDPLIPARLETDASGAALVCVPGVTCYSKNLWHWSEELHARRAEAEARWAAHGGRSYPALATPFPTVHRHTFTTADRLHAYINPSRCDQTRVDQGPTGNGMPSALGVIKVLP